MCQELLILAPFQGSGVQLHRGTTGPVRDVPQICVPKGGRETTDADYHWVLCVPERSDWHVRNSQSVRWRGHWRRWVDSLMWEREEIWSFELFQLWRSWRRPEKQGHYNPSTCERLWGDWGTVGRCSTDARIKLILDLIKDTEDTARIRLFYRLYYQ